VRFGRRGVEKLVADHLDYGMTYKEVAKKYDVALSTVGKYIQQAKRQRTKATA
jgi:sigma-70, region 4